VPALTGEGIGTACLLACRCTLLNTRIVAAIHGTPLLRATCKLATATVKDVQVDRIPASSVFAHIVSSVWHTLKCLAVLPSLS
jgi:hypothetical protein